MILLLLNKVLFFGTKVAWHGTCARKNRVARVQRAKIKKVNCISLLHSAFRIFGFALLISQFACRFSHFAYLICGFLTPCGLFKVIQTCSRTHPVRRHTGLISIVFSKYNLLLAFARMEFRLLSKAAISSHQQRQTTLLAKKTCLQCHRVWPLARFFRWHAAFLPECARSSPEYYQTVCVVCEQRYKIAQGERCLLERLARAVLERSRRAGFANDTLDGEILLLQFVTQGGKLCSCTPASIHVCASPDGTAVARAPCDRYVPPKCARCSEPMSLFAQSAQSLLRLEQRIWLGMSIMSEPGKMTLQRVDHSRSFCPSVVGGGNAGRRCCNFELVCARHNSDALYAPSITDEISEMVALSASVISERANRRDDNRSFQQQQPVFDDNDANILLRAFDVSCQCHVWVVADRLTVQRVLPYWEPIHFSGGRDLYLPLRGGKSVPLKRLLAGSGDPPSSEDARRSSSSSVNFTNQASVRISHSNGNPLDVRRENLSVSSFAKRARRASPSKLPPLTQVVKCATSEDEEDKEAFVR